MSANLIFWDIFAQENYFVWVREVFHKSRIPTKLNLNMQFQLFCVQSDFLSDSLECSQIIKLRLLLGGLHRCWWRMLETMLSPMSRHQVTLPTSRVRHQHHILAYYDVGDRLECHQHAEKCHQHIFYVTNILKWSPSLSHQHNDVTNITVTL